MVSRFSPYTPNQGLSIFNQRINIPHQPGHANFFSPRHNDLFDRKPEELSLRARSIRYKRKVLAKAFIATKTRFPLRPAQEIISFHVASSTSASQRVGISTNRTVPLKTPKHRDKIRWQYYAVGQFLGLCLINEAVSILPLHSKVGRAQYSVYSLPLGDENGVSEPILRKDYHLSYIPPAL